MEKHLGYKFSDRNFEKVKDILDGEDIGGRVDEVLQQLSCLKQVCNKTIAGEFRQHSKVFNEAVLKRGEVEKVIERCKHLEEELTKQKEMLAEISSCSKEGVEREVAKGRIKGEVVAMVAEINDILWQTGKLIGENDLQAASLTLVKAKKTISFAMMENKVLTNSKVLKHFQQSEQNYKKEIEEILRKSMHESICWGYREEGGIESVTLRLTSNHLNPLVTSLDCLGLLQNVLTDFADRLMRKVFEEVIFHGASVEGGGGVMVVKEGRGLEGKKEESIEMKNAEDVLQNLEKAIEFIGSGLVESEGGCVLLKGVGERLGGELFGLVGREVVGKRNNEDISSFEAIMKIVDRCKSSAAKFYLTQDTLPSTNMMKDDAASAFISCKCRHYLILARTILKKPLHHYTNNINKDNISKDRITNNDKGITKDNKNSINKMKKVSTGSNTSKDKTEDIFGSDFRHFFDFPDCHISKSIQEYWQNIERMIQEVGGFGVTVGDGGMIVGVAIRRIVDLFIVLSPSLHHDEIENLAYVAALHHNNCFYLAHQLILLQTKLALPQPRNYQPSNSQSTNPQSTSPQSTIPQSTIPQSIHLSWVDMVGVLRGLGVDALGKVVNDQKDHLRNIIKSEAVVSDLSRPANLRVTQRCMRKVTMKLQHMLKSSLQVLPSPVCVKMIGDLLGVVVMEVVAIVTSVEDMSESDAVHLIGMVTKLHDDAVSLFGALLRGQFDDEDGDDGDGGGGVGASVCVDKRDVVVCLRRHVEGWGGFEEVKWLMGAKLMDIGERWASGMGPLADELSSSEVERMIRALFMNTEMRSTVLASIRETPS